MQKIFNISTTHLFAATAVEKLMGFCIPLLLSIIVNQLLVKPYLNQVIIVTELLVDIPSLVALLAFLSQAQWKRTSRKTQSWGTGALKVLRAQNEKIRNRHTASQTSVILAITAKSISWAFRSVFPMHLIIDACAQTFVLSLSIEMSNAPAGLSVGEVAVIA